MDVSLSGEEELRTWLTLALLGWGASFLKVPAWATVSGGDAEPQVAIFATEALPGGATGLRAKIAGHSGLFLFDTGGGVTIVTPSTAALSGCHVWGQITGFRATGERLDTRRCDDLRVSLNNQVFTASIASVFDLQPLVSPDMPVLSGLIALDLFANRVLTIRPLAHELVVETASSLQQRIKGATEVPARLVRDVEGVALTVDGAVATPAGRAWMELDTGNLGPTMVGEHVASALSLDATRREVQPASFALVGGVPVKGPARVSRLIMDGDIGQSVLCQWDVTIDLVGGRAWFRLASTEASSPR